MTRKRTPCARCDHGWIYDESTDPPTVTKCPCRSPETPEQAATRAIKWAAQARPAALRHAYSIIEAECEISQYVNANTVRTAMETAQIPGPVRAAAFRQAVAEGLLEAEGEIVSAAESTHGKKLVQYRSRSYSRQLGVEA